MKVTLGNGIIELKDVALWTKGELFGAELDVGSVCTDSREAKEGTLFCAIKGERVDGHDYIVKAYMLGCRTFLAEKVPKEVEELNDIGIVVVDDTVKALNAMAAAYSEKSNFRKIAVTGSVGKTTTKDFVSLAFGEKKIHKTEGNFNSTIGMPLSLMSAKSDTEIVVIEMGMSAKGEIKLMSETAKPDIAIITNVGTSHIEMLGSRENIRDAKLEITAGLSKNGVLIINGDDNMLKNIAPDVKLISVGVDREDCDIRATDINEKENGTEFSVVLNGEKKDGFFIPVLGKHNIYAALFAYAAVFALKENEADAIKGISRFEKPKMRQNIFQLGGITIIEDCYNASPESMKAALDVQAGIVKRNGKGRSVALLGNMLELGSYSKELHAQVGEYASQKKLQKLVTFGEFASHIADASGIDGAVKIDDVTSHEKAAETLLSILKEGDVLLVKASRGVAAEKIIEILKERMK